MESKHWIIAGIVVAIILAFILPRACSKSKPDIIAAVDSVQYWKNKYGESITSIKQREQDYYKASEGYLDSIAKLHNTKDNLLQEIAVLIQKGRAKIKSGQKPIFYRIGGDTTRLGMISILPPGFSHAPYIMPDTNLSIYNRDGQYPLFDTFPRFTMPILSSGVQQKFSSPWYLAKVDIPFNGDSSTMDLETFDTLRYVVKQVKEGGLFNRRIYLQVDAVNTNPYNKIEGLAVYRKPLPKPKKIGIGLQLGYGFSNSLKPAPYLGLGIQYSIIRF